MYGFNPILSLLVVSSIVCTGTIGISVGIWYNFNDYFPLDGYDEYPLDYAENKSSDVLTKKLFVAVAEYKLNSY